MKNTVFSSVCDTQRKIVERPIFIFLQLFLQAFCVRWHQINPNCTRKSSKVECGDRVVQHNQGHEQDEPPRTDGHLWPYAADRPGSHSGLCPYSSSRFSSAVRAGSEDAEVGSSRGSRMVERLQRARCAKANSPKVSTPVTSAFYDGRRRSYLSASSVVVEEMNQ